MSETAPILREKSQAGYSLFPCCNLHLSSPGSKKKKKKNMASTEPLILEGNPSSLARHSIPTQTSFNDSRPGEDPQFKQKKSRMVQRSNGRSIIRHQLSPQSYISYIQDFFTSIINARWYTIILFFFSMYVFSWILFSCLWTALAYIYNDDATNITCVYHVNDFKSAFLFSVETQTTIGFGFRYPSSACGVGILLLVIQSVAGLIIDSFLLGLMFAKITRPRNRRKTIFFSKNAVIYTETVKKGGSLFECGGRIMEKDVQQQRVLEFRIADVRRSQVVEGHVRLQLYWYRETLSGGYELQQYDLDVGYDTGRDRVFLLTPVSVYHYITQDSPLYQLTPDILTSSQLELVVVLEGIVEATGLTAQMLWSYTQDEIIFDKSFQPMTYYSETNREWNVNFSNLSSLQTHRKC